MAIIRSNETIFNCRTLICILSSYTGQSGYVIIVRESTVQRVPTEKPSKFGLNESPAQNENYGGLFDIHIYTILVIDYCSSEMVKISLACRALTISP
jgi:hypothetical protein